MHRDWTLKAQIMIWHTLDDNRPSRDFIYFNVDFSLSFVYESSQRITSVLISKIINALHFQESFNFFYQFTLLIFQLHQYCHQLQKSLRSRVIVYKVGSFISYKTFQLSMQSIRRSPQFERSQVVSTRTNQMTPYYEPIVL